jgi:hypothetical protein
MITSRPEEFVSVRDNIVETIEQRITNNNIILVAYYTDDVHNKRLAAVAYYYIRQHIYTRITMRILRIYIHYTRIRIRRILLRSQPDHIYYRVHIRVAVVAISRVHKICIKTS